MHTMSDYHYIMEAKEAKQNVTKGQNWVQINLSISNMASVDLYFGLSYLPSVG